MPTIFTKGDLLHTDGVRAYAHGCDRAGTMDAGVSVAFKKRWPRMLEAYAQRCAERKPQLGEVIAWNEGTETVYCLVIQEGVAKKATLSALSRSLKTMVDLAATAGIDRIALPRLGTGSGGLDGPRVKSILQEVGAETSVTLLVFEQFVRARSA